MSTANGARPLRLGQAGPSHEADRRYPAVPTDAAANGADYDEDDLDSQEYDEQTEDEDLGQSFFVRALYSFQSNDASSLSFRRGDIIEVLTQLESGWWDGLLNSDVRGWFPSNYVERIDDAEAERVLTEQEEAQHDSGPSTEGKYERLGITSDFEALRQLMSDTQGPDPFEQLAEAAMISSRDSMSPSGQGSSDRLTVTTKRRSRISDQSSHIESSMATPSEVNSMRSQTDMSSLPSRSAAPSIADGDLARKMQAPISASGSLPEMSDRDRHRSQSVWLNDGSQTQAGRPRAQTTLNPPPMSLQASRSRLDRDLPSRPRSDRVHDGDFWVPKVTDRGDIVYVNTRTGAQSRDMPEGLGLPSGPQSPVSEKMRMSGGPSMPRHDQNGNRSTRADSIVDPPEVPYPWVARRDPNDMTYQYFNRQTLQSTNDIAVVLGKSLSNISIRDDTKQDGPFALTDEDDARRLQAALAAEEPLHQAQYAIEEAKEDVDALTTLMHEPIDADGLNEQDRGRVSLDTLRGSSRLGHLIEKAVRSVRDALHVVGAIGVAQTDLIASSELIRLLDDDASLEAFSAFFAAVTALQARDGKPDSLAVQPHVTSGLAVAASRAQSNALHPIGRRVCALLSKLVLSSRSVVEHSHLNVVARPAISQAQLEKIKLYRTKIRDDSAELSRVLHTFEQEVERVIASAHTTSGDASPSNVRSHLRSGAGTAGVGLEILGGGSGSGWKGNGFVLPSALEAAALRAEAQGEFQSAYELNADARLALSTGKIALRRKPGLVFSRRMIEARLGAPMMEVNRQLSDLRALARSPEYQVATKGNANGYLTPSQEEVLLNRVRGILNGSGAVLVIVEEFDLASALDVDGPGLDFHKTLQDSAKDVQGIKRVRTLLHNFAVVKQRCYDAGSLLMIQVQDLAAEPQKMAYAEQLDDVFDIGKELQSTIQALYTALTDLAEVQEAQDSTSTAAIGLRAKVYGIDDVELEGGRTARDDRESFSASPSPTAGMSRNGSMKRTASQGHAAPEVIPTGTRKERASSRSSAKALKILGDLPPPTPSVIGTEHSDGTHSVGGHTTASGKTVEALPWFLQLDTPPEDIVYSETGQVKGATLPGLMERLTTHLAYDPAFNTTFLHTYQSFTTTDELLDLLFARFRIAEPEELTPEEHAIWVEKKQRPIQLRVFNVLKLWIEGHCTIEGENDAHLARIKTFAHDEMQHSPFMASPANLLLRSIERRSGRAEQLKITMVLPLSAPPPLLPKNLKKIKFLDIDPLEMARQLTLMDSKLYNRIRPAECLNKAWSREDGAEVAKAIRDVISANNRVSGWVSEAILVQEDLKKRAGWVKHFVAIADRCFYLNNFSSMMAIYSGLNNASLNRLRRTWDAVNQRHLQLFENMRALLAPTKNFSKYRETLRKLQPPCVPFLGVYLTDLTFIEDGNSDRLRSDDRLINFSKRQMTAEKIQEIVIYQSTPYNLTPVAGIQKFIEENLIDARSDDELYDQSLRLEPREREDEKIARLLQESGFL